MYCATYYVPTIYTVLCCAVRTTYDGTVESSSVLHFHLKLRNATDLPLHNLTTVWPDWTVLDRPLLDSTVLHGPGRYARRTAAGETRGTGAAKHCLCTLTARGRRVMYLEGLGYPHTPPSSARERQPAHRRPTYARIRGPLARAKSGTE